MDETASGEDRLHRSGVLLSDAEFREEADHIWLNALLCIRPTEEFAADVGHMVIAKVMESRLRTEPWGDYPGSRACVLWINAS